MPTYLITGGAGFIGSHLADALLARGCQVRVLDDFSTGRAENIDPRCDVMRGDVTDPAAVRRALEGTAGCFHLAAIASVARANEEWMATHRVNLGGTITVHDAARALGGLPVVYASSAAVYGNVSGVAHEALAPSPLTAYGADKLGSEQHARVAGHALEHGRGTAGVGRGEEDGVDAGEVALLGHALQEDGPHHAAPADQSHGGHGGRVGGVHRCGGSGSHALQASGPAAHASACSTR